MTQVFEGKVRKHSGDRELLVIDAGPGKDGWVALHPDNLAKVGERYRVTIERLRAPLPEGLAWVEGENIIRQESIGVEWKLGWYTSAGVAVQSIYATRGCSVPVAVLEAFKAEGLL